MCPWSYESIFFPSPAGFLMDMAWLLRSTQIWWETPRSFWASNFACIDLFKSPFLTVAIVEVSVPWPMLRKLCPAILSRSRAYVSSVAMLALSRVRKSSAFLRLSMLWLFTTVNLSHRHSAKFMFIIMAPRFLDVKIKNDDGYFCRWLLLGRWK